MITLKTWLEGIGLARYESLFVENDVDVDTIFDLTEHDLRDLGISMGDRKRFMREIEKGKRPSRIGSPDAHRAERRQLTVFFCDLVDSTALSADLELEQYRRLMTDFHACCAEAVERFNGNIERYEGDGVLVYFGYPMGDEHASENAVRAARAIMTALERIGERVHARVKARVGISTGVVIVGDLLEQGSARERLVVGDTPIIARRLQEIAAPGQVVVSEMTRLLAGGHFEYQDLGEHKVKGFNALAAWAVVGEIRTDSRFDVTRGSRKVSRLAGREDESRWLLDLWEKCKEGNRKSALVVGEAGIGKSRLLLAVQDRLQDEELFEVQCSCGPRYQDSALYPIANYVEGLAAIAGSDSVETKLKKLEDTLDDYFDDMTIIVPLFASLLSIPLIDPYVALALGPRLQKERLFDSITSLLTRRQPALLMFEDLQWADPTTLELVDRLVARDSNDKVLILMTARPSFLMQHEHEHYPILHLDRLAAPDAACIVSDVCDQGEFPPELIEQVLAKADGVPLFVEELTKTLIEACALDETTRRYVPEAAIGELSIPSTLHDSLIARLDRLGPARKLAQLGAVIGRQFPHRLIASVYPKSVSGLQDDLNRLVDSNLITVEGNPPKSVYRFHHALIQDAAYSTLLRGERTRLHGEIASALEELRDELNARPELIAFHCAKAEDAQKAIHYWLEAGMQSRARAAHAEAVQHLTAGLEQLAKVDETVRDRLELELRIQLGLNLEAAGGYADSKVAENFARASELCERLDEAVESVPVLLGHYVFRLVRADYAMARDLAIQCVRLAEQSGHPEHLIEACAALGHVLPQLGELTEAVPILRRCIELSRNHAETPLAEITAQDPEIASLGQLAIVMWLSGKPDRAHGYIEEALARQARLGKPINEAMICPYAAMVRAFCGDWQLSLDYAERGMSVAREYGYDYWYLLNQAHSGIALASQGSFDDGYEQWTQATQRLRHSRAFASLSYFCSAMAAAAVDAGEWAIATGLIGAAIDHRKQFDEGFVAPLLYIVKARTRLRPGSFDVAAADRDLCEAVAIAQDQHSVSFELRAELERHRLHSSDDTEASLEALKRAYEAIEGGKTTSDISESTKLLAASVSE